MVTIDINESFPDELLSEQCGGVVVISITGTPRVTLRYNSAGLVVSEVDKAGGSKITYSSPDTGKSFSFPNLFPSFDYEAGAQVGSPVTIRVTGLLGHVTGQIRHTVVCVDAGFAPPPDGSSSRSEQRGRSYSRNRPAVWGIRVLRSRAVGERQRFC